MLLILQIRNQQWLLGGDTDLVILHIYFVNNKKVENDVFFMSDKNIKSESKGWSIRFACEQLGQCVCDGILSIMLCEVEIPRQRSFLLVKVQP